MANAVRKSLPAGRIGKRKTVTTIDDNATDVYAAITGDQVALTNINILTTDTP